MRRLRGAILALALAAAPAAAAPAFDPAPWLADLDQLRDAMSVRYPNLEWQADRGLDLPAVYGRARQGLGDARSEAEARLAFERFLARFADGHLEARWPAPESDDEASPSRPLCDRLGFFDVGNAGAIASRLPGYRPLGDVDSPLPAGVVTIDGRTIGVLRLSMFDPHGFPAICERLVAEAKLRPNDPCDAACEQRLSERADAIFVGDMASQLKALATAAPDALLVDIAENGGGNDSALVLAHMVTGVPIKAPRMGFVRSAAWADELAERQAAVRLGLREPADRGLLAPLDEKLTLARVEAGKPCDLSPLWRGEPPGCSLVVADTLFAAGLTPDGPAQARGKAWGSAVSATARFPAAAAIWRGPLLILVDGDSASASELFAAMLQDGRAAVVIGAPTFGAGCGHASGAGPVHLKNSGGVISMPDCLRLRADGSNEVAGVQPDLLIGFREYDTPRERVERLARVLPAALARAAPRP